MLNLRKTKEKAIKSHLYDLALSNIIKKLPTYKIWVITLGLSVIIAIIMKIHSLGYISLIFCGVTILMFVSMRGFYPSYYSSDKFSNQFMRNTESSQQGQILKKYINNEIREREVLIETTYLDWGMERKNMWKEQIKEYEKLLQKINL